MGQSPQMTVGFARMNVVAPELARLLTEAAPRSRREATRASCALAIERSSLSDPRVVAAFNLLDEARYGASPTREAVQSLAEEIDIQAATIREKGGQAATAYKREFSRARSAAALGFALEEDSLHAALEAIYEASLAIDDVDLLMSTVTPLLRTGG